MEDVKHPRLTTRGRMYWFRAKVPVDLRAHYAPKTEIIYSLKTSNPKEALEKVRVESVKIDQQFLAARRKISADVVTSISDVEIDRLVAIHLHNLLDEDEQSRINGLDEETLYLSVKSQVESSPSISFG